MNKRNIISTFLAFVAMTSWGQVKNDTQGTWETDAWDNVHITSMNRLRSHTLEIPVASASEAATAYTPTNANEASPYFLSLNGTWQFQWVGTPEKASATFMGDAFDASQWDTIEVPSSWQVFGVRHNKNWDKPLYTNVAYPFTYDRETWSIMADRPSHFSYSGEMKNPVGSYRRNFNLPADWKGRKVFLRLNGAGHGYYVWINGQLVGYAEDSYLPSDFDITDKLRPGNNNISVRVYRFTSGSFLEDQDYWRLTGITRDIYLYSTPKTLIGDFFFRTTALKADNTQAEAALTVNIAGSTPKKATLEARLTDGSRMLGSQTIDIKKTGEVELMFNNISGIKAWSAEQPQLYDLVLTLSEKGKPIDIRTVKVGFRMVDVRADGALLVNGKRIIFHGVDRHSFSENGGRTLTKAEIETDLMQMKRLNVNAIRTSHYPDNPYFYDLCDRLGFYVLAEANVECHGNTRLSHLDLFRQPMVERSIRQVLTLRNHPAIVIWSAGNESGNGNNFETVMDSIGRLDSTRLTHYEGNSQWSSVTSTMYGNLGLMESIGSDRLRDFEQGKTGIRPHVQCENTHAMGNSMGNQREFFDIYEQYPAMAGEFVWDWKDQGLKMSATNQPLTFEALGRQGKTDVRSTLNPSKGEYWAYGGDFGDIPNDNNFCCNGVVLADCTPTAKSYAMKKVYQPLEFALSDGPNGIFTLKSKLQQRVLNDLAVSYVLLEDGIEIGSGKLPPLQLAVGETSQVTIADAKALITAPPHPEAEYFIRFSACQTANTEWADAGFEVAAEEIQLHNATGRQPYATTTQNEPLKVTSDDSTITINGQSFNLRFAHGQLAAYTLNGKELLAAPLSLQAFRLPTDNERGKSRTYDQMGIRKLTPGQGKMEVNKEKNGQSVDVETVVTYASEGNYQFDVKQLFKVFSDGIVVVNTDVTPNLIGGELPRLGFRAEMPCGFETMRWLGRGPQDSYRDRKEAAFVGLHHSRVGDEWTNYVLPQEQGNKEDVRWMAITNDQGLGLLVTAPELMAASAAHWRPEDNYQDARNRTKHPYEMNFCEETILNIDAYNRALGNASCGPDVIDRYRIVSDKTHFTFLLMPIAKHQTDQQLAERARFTSPFCSPVTIKSSKGTVSLSCPTPDATIYYSIDGSKEKEYTTPFELVKGGKVSARAAAKGLLSSSTNVEQVGAYVSKDTWRVVSVSSEQGGNEAAKNVIDENPATIWHTQYRPQTPQCPHEIVIDMGETHQVASFVYQGREDMSNGRIARYEFYVSDSPDNWGEPALKGQLENSSGRQQVDVPSKPSGRYFRVIVQSTYDRRGYASAAEFGIIPL